MDGKWDVDAYDRWFDSPGGRLIFESELDAVKLVSGGLKHPMLEIGVGTGRFAQALNIDSGIDPSEEALNIAKNRGIKVIKASADALPYPDESFNAVFMLFTLCFVSDPSGAVMEAKRVMTKHGGLVIGIINKQSPWGRLYLDKKSKGHPIYKHANFYSPDELISMLNDACLNIASIASTLLQPPADNPYKEAPSRGIMAGAGFVCVLAEKT